MGFLRVAPPVRRQPSDYRTTAITRGRSASSVLGTADAMAGHGGTLGADHRSRAGVADYELLRRLFDLSDGSVRRDRDAVVLGGWTSKVPSSPRFRAAR